ncbi:type IV pilus modification PilV family protein [Neptuniibacter sp. QD48_55]|uniref:type IV pilus modification PilV family protein n=1 Tax=Neptuniibacter sp. QD48_55 TaxID=3398212 RepID=UPI0039F461BE
MYQNRYEKGFTLIEALLAFVIVAIGLIGAALFQSELVTESGNSKARAVAVKLAEQKLEQERVVILENSYASLALASYPESTNVTVGNTAYTVSYSLASTAAASFQTHYMLGVDVTWTDSLGNAESVSLNSRLVWNDPKSSFDSSDQAGTGTDESIGSFERPSGSAVATARETSDEVHDATKSVGDWIELADNKYGIKITDDECINGDAGCDQVVTVIELVDLSSPIFSIKGNIYVDSSVSVSYEDLEASPNVLTSEGGGCAVYELGSDIGYTCLFGEGWYGTIALLLPDAQGSNKPGACISPREYKYYGIDPATVSGTIQSSDVIGQSGLVRFTTTNGPGPYLAASNAAPGLGYYYMYSEVDTNVEDTQSSLLNTSGNLLNQHFLVINTNGNKDCSDFLTALNNVPAGYPSLSTDDYSYTDGVTVTIPDEEKVLGYVNLAYEISGQLDVSSVASGAEGLLSTIEVGVDPLPDFAQQCELEVLADQILGYSCFVDYSWNGTVTPSVVSGAVVSFDFAPLEYDFSLSPVTADVTSGKDFVVTDTP